MRSSLCGANGSSIEPFASSNVPSLPAIGAQESGFVPSGVKTTIKDNGAYGLICVQGIGKINNQPLNSPKLIRFTELTEDEYFCTEDGAKNGVTFENTSETEPLVVLRYFGPEVNPDAPAMGAYRKNKFN